MIPVNIPLVAKILTPISSRDFRGRGIVEKKIDGNTYEIRLPSGKITVALKSGTLTPNTPVAISQKGQQIVIQTLPAQASAGDRFSASGNTLNPSTARDVREFLSLLKQISAANESEAPKETVQRQLEMVARILNENKYLFEGDLKNLSDKIARAAESDSAHPSEKAQTVSIELNELLSAFEKRLSETVSLQKNAITLPPETKQEFLFFAGRNDLQAWLDKTQSGAQISTYGETQIEKTVPVIVRTYLSDTGDMQALILEKEKAAVEIDHFLKNELKSQLWKLVSSDTIIDILENRGAVSTERLKEIDEYIILKANVVPQFSERPQHELEPAIRQWISSLLDNDNASRTFAERIPLNSASEIGKLYLKIAEAIVLNYDLKEIKSADDFSINEKTFLSQIPRGEIIPLLFQRIGYSTEQELLNLSQSPEPKDLPENLKILLFNLLGTVEKNIEGVAEPVQTTDNVHEPKIDNINSFLEKTIQTELVKNSARINELLDQIARLDAQEVTDNSISRDSASRQTDILRQILSGISDILNPRSDAVNIQSALSDSAAAGLSQQHPAPHLRDAPFSISDIYGKDMTKLARLFESVLQSLDNTEQKIPEDFAKNLSLNAQKTAENTEIFNRLTTQIEPIKDTIKVLLEFIYSQDRLANRADAENTVKDESIQPQPESGTNISSENLRILFDKLIGILRNINSAETDATPDIRISTDDITPENVKNILNNIIGLSEKNAEKIIEILQNMPVESDLNTAKTAIAANISLPVIIKETTLAIEVLFPFVRFEPALSPAHESQAPEAQNTEAPPDIPLENQEPPSVQMVSSRSTENYIFKITQLIDQTENKFLPQIRLFAAQLGETNKTLAGELILKIENLLESMKNLRNSLLEQASGRQINLPDNLKNSIFETVADKIQRMFDPMASGLSKLPLILEANLKTLEQSLPNGAKSLFHDISQIFDNIGGSINKSVETIGQNTLVDSENQTSFNVDFDHSRISGLARSVDNIFLEHASKLTAAYDTAVSPFKNASELLADSLSSWEKTVDHIKSNETVLLSTALDALRGSIEHTIVRQSPIQAFPGENAAMAVTEQLKDSYPELFTRTEQSAAEILKAFQATAGQQLDDTLKQMQNVYEACKEILKETESAVKNALNETLDKIDHIIRENQGKPEVVNENINRSMTLLDKLSDQIKQLIENSIKQITRIFSDSQKTPEFISPEQRLGDIDEGLKQLKREIDALLKNTGKNIDELTERSMKAIESSTSSGIKEQIETALNRIESLQLLAKPANTQEGQQQIIALPVRIDDEWTEVTIRLIKKHDNSKKKREKDRYSVAINISPTFLGPIAIQMEYHEKRNLSVRINSEKNATRMWFEKHKTNISEALSRLGFKSVNLAMRTALLTDNGAVRRRLLIPVDEKANIDIRI